MRPVALVRMPRLEPLEERRLLAGVPQLLAEINPGAGSDPNEFINAGGTVFFRSDDGSNGAELWKTDGTVAGTVLVRDIRPGPNGSAPTGLVDVGGTLFFAADDGTGGVELWKSDGTVAGTMLVKNINPAGSSSPSSLTNVGGTLYFAADDGTNGIELWKSDGTEPGTTMVANINGLGSSDPRYLTNVGGKLFFSADNGSNGQELWLSDPGAMSTTMVKDIHTGGAGSYPGYLGALESVGGLLFFAAFDPSNGFELWKSDGTSGGTTLVKDVNVGVGSSFPFQMAAVGNTLFFTADDGFTGFELWKTDGTTGGTTQVKDIKPAGASSTPDALTNVGGTLFFRADNGINGVELWTSDGTMGGTQMVLDINTTGDSVPRYLTNVAGTLYFRASQGTGLGKTGTELWYSNGTSGGTLPAADIAPGTASSSPKNLANVSGTLFFSAASTGGNHEPWIAAGAGASVAATHLFYNQSGFDGFDAAANSSDDAAIAPNKSAYLPGSGPATFANVSSYSKGINGVMFDLAGAHGPLRAADFTLRVGTSNTPSLWPLAPQPTSIVVRPGAGVAGSDRVELVWANGAIKQTWLQVTLKANYDTNLTLPYAFLFGNAVGDSGLGNPPGAAATDSTDEIAARNTAGPALITSIADYNRDQSVDATDELIARNNPGFLPLLNVLPPVHGRYLFYNQSMFDGNNPAADSSDDAAIASNKSAYLPGAFAATFANISSYSRGINGVMIDLAGSHPGITAADFTFKMGDNNSPAAWTAAPPPTTVLVRAGAGINGSDRIELVWANGAIANTWLQITMAAGANTGLSSPDVFYFGNRIGDTGSDLAPTFALTDATDEIETRNNQGVAISVSNPYDFDRDGFVGATDQVITRGNLGFLTKISLPLAPPAALPADSGDESADALDAVATALTAPSVRSQVRGAASSVVPPADHATGPGRSGTTSAVGRIEVDAAARDLPSAALDEASDWALLDGDLLDELIAGLELR